MGRGSRRFESCHPDQIQRRKMFKYKVGDVVKVTETGDSAIIVAQVTLQGVNHYIVHIYLQQDEELWEESELESI